MATLITLAQYRMHDDHTPMQILDRRLAEGGITPDDYKERAAILDGR